MESLPANSLAQGASYPAYPSESKPEKRSWRSILVQNLEGGSQVGDWNEAADVGFPFAETEGMKAEREPASVRAKECFESLKHCQCFQ